MTTDQTSPRGHGRNATPAPIRALDRAAEAGLPLTTALALDVLRHERELHGGRADAPGSRFGTSFESWAPAAAAVAVILAGETGEATYAELIDQAASLVVNDHDDAEYLLREYGPLYGIDSDVLGDLTLALHEEV